MRWQGDKRTVAARDLQTHTADTTLDPACLSVCFPQHMSSSILAPRIHTLVIWKTKLLLPLLSQGCLKSNIRQREFSEILYDMCITCVIFQILSCEFTACLYSLHLIPSLTSFTQYLPAIILFLLASVWLDTRRTDWLQISADHNTCQWRQNRPTRRGIVFFPKVVRVGRWDGITAQIQDPLGTVGCEAHMGKQAADELLTRASHHGLPEEYLH